MADQLSIYNGALLACEERFLASLTEEVESRRLLDHVWSTGGIKYCLEQGQWHFAMRTIQIDYDPSVEPSYGYRRAFQKPDDWLITSALCTDEYFRSPALRYADEAGFWYSDIDTLYVRFVSIDPGYGYNLASWPESFREYVEHYFGSRVYGKLGGSATDVADLVKLTEEKLEYAKNRAAMVGPTTFPARGTWSQSRNRFPNRRDGGNSSGNLIG